MVIAGIGLVVGGVMNAFEEHQEKISKEKKREAKKCFANPFSKHWVLFDFSRRSMLDNEADAHNEPMYPINGMARAMKILDDFRKVSYYLTQEQSRLIDTYTEKLLRQCSTWMSAFADDEHYEPSMQNFFSPAIDTEKGRDLGRKASDAMSDLLETVHYVLWWNGKSMYYDTVNELREVASHSS